MTWQEYEAGLENESRELHATSPSGRVSGEPVRRELHPQAGWRQRPLGIAAVEDKIVQQAVVTVLNAIYEEDFLGFSYGFRPKRSQHDALDALIVGIERKKVNWVLDADVREFLERSSHYPQVVDYASKRSG